MHTARVKRAVEPGDHPEKPAILSGSSAPPGDDDPAGTTRRFTASAPRPRRVLVVEDDPGFFRTAILPVFAQGFSLMCAHNIPQAHDALDATPSLSLALVDLNMPGGEPFEPDKGEGGGLEIARRIRDQFPAVRCAILTGYTTPALVNAAQLCGAEFIAKEDCSDNLEALRDKITSETRSVFTHWQQHIDSFVAAHRLSARQADTLTLAVLGHSYRDIAERMDLSVNTVKTHIHQVLTKAGYTTIKEIVAEWARK